MQLKRKQRQLLFTIYKHSRVFTWNPTEYNILFVLVENFREHWNMVVLFFQMECFIWKFVPQFLLAIFDTSFRPLQPFFGNCTELIFQRLNMILVLPSVTPEVRFSDVNETN